MWNCVTRCAWAGGTGLIVLTMTAVLCVGCTSNDRSTPDRDGVIAAEGQGSTVNNSNDRWEWPRFFKGGSLGEQMGLADATWSPQPVAVRIAPSTRVLLEDEEPILDAAIQLLDDMGDSTKAAGVVRFELFEAQSHRDADVVATERRLYAWDIELLTQKQQQVYYNPILRGYNFRLGVDDIRLRQMPTVLLVSFNTADGQRLQARQPLSRDW